MRFRKSIRIAPGLRLNLSRSGVSTTLGGRGASVNFGKKGTRATVGIPGSGFSFSQRLSRPAGGGGSGDDGSNAGKAQASGCASVGCLGFFLLVLLGMCMDTDSPASSRVPTSSPSYSAPSYEPSGYGTSAYSAAAEREAPEWFYIHGTLNVRAEPRPSAAIVRTLRRGDYVQLGPKDASGWARLHSAGSAEGYVYRASDLVQKQAPAAQSTESRALSSGTGGGSRRSSGSRVYHTGPRGGCYYYSGSGNKQYVDRSYCH
jgi:hypothetical protein